ncbi:putative membrane protein YfhO [Salibacterium salarium]|uniref:YfhO family protein n=1 Tax=Salibacterium salarium TaxID=284579 RepID=UPI0027808240|nr:YfhO family protein [Salibacterium salarium]MDQ0298353.1 putative membrane protein YfhO [Salibacterium salarium]
MKRKRTLFILFVCSFVLAVLAHLFFLKEWTEGQYMLGSNDGLQQMVTFKKLLYEQYTDGNFFYSYQFGLGGGTYSQLAFYFSTSLVFLITTVVVFVLEFVHFIETTDVIFWAKAAVFISICRLTLILFITTYVFRYMKLNWMPAFTGAAVYGLSIMYYRHVIYWEFFADAMIWLPLLVLGAEKMIREGRCGWFIVAFALTLFDNFYFAYINLLFIVIYVIFRFVVRLDANEISGGKRVPLFVISGLVGLGISAVSFIPAVYGFLHNHRPSYSLPIETFDFSDNILFTSRVVILPVLYVLFVFTFSLYKIMTFRLFVLLSILFIIFHFSPVVASVFNGFSAPKYRFEYLLSFVMGGAVSTGLQYITIVGKKNILTACLMVLAIYLLFFYKDQDLSFYSFPSIGMFLFMLLILTLAMGFTWKRNMAWYVCLHAGTLFICIGIVNIAQYAISEYGGVNQVSDRYLNSDEYNGEEQRELLEKIKERESGSFYRIDWKVRSLNNTPIVQDFNGISAYSSILNQHLLYFYLYDLNVDMGRESVSRYATLGHRTNLYSLFQGKYMIRKKSNTANIPYGFEKMLSSKHYNVYENTNILPFVRTTDQIFSEESMEKANVLEREHAMLEGAIVADGPTTTTEIRPVPNMINQTSIETVGASFENDKLSVTEKKGGIDLLIDNPDVNTEDYFVRFHLENQAESQGFTLKVNDYKTKRKHNQSVYKTYVDDLIIRVPKADKISIRIPKGNYILKDLGLFRENYQTLETVKEEPSNTEYIKWGGDKLTITHNNEKKDRYMMLPIPYERGWEVHVNNVRQPLKKVNYAFLGFPITEGINTIQLTYTPPFFKPSLLLTIVSTILAILWIRRHITK